MAITIYSKAHIGAATIEVNGNEVLNVSATAANIFTLKANTGTPTTVFAVANTGKMYVKGNGSGVYSATPCRGWALFKGTTTTTLLGGENISSVTDNGTGNTTITLTTAMPDANFAVIGSAQNSTQTGFGAASRPTSSSTILVISYNDAGTKADMDIVSISIYK